MNLLDRILYHTNIYVALCATVMYAETCYHLNFVWSIQELCGIFSGTLFIYNINRLLLTGLLKQSSLARHQWIVKNKIPLWVLTAISGLGIVYSIPAFNVEILIYLIILGFISVAYSVPIFGKSLRAMPGMKLLLIVFVWTVVTAVIPAHVHVLESAEAVRTYDKVIWERIFFIAMLAMGFNIRDAETDAKEGLQTIPVIIGEKNASRLSVPLGVMAIFFGIQFSMEYGIVMGMCDFSTAVVLWKTPYIKKEPWYSYVMDGMMLMRFILLLIIINV